MRVVFRPWDCDKDLHIVEADTVVFTDDVFSYCTKVEEEHRKIGGVFLRSFSGDEYVIFCNMIPTFTEQCYELRHCPAFCIQDDIDADEAEKYEELQTMNSF